MTEEEKAEAIRQRDVVRARAASGGAGTPGPCSAGDNCVAKEGSQAIVTKCPHGNGRHFACARVACSPDCGEGGAPSNTPSPKRRSPRKHEATRRR
ncbi:unnamed protein product [Ectocarpus sp. CCAP 1310/34]|nr:unnamed protein product [Ectocarpus sp. CCAP 1310/34]